MILIKCQSFWASFSKSVSFAKSTSFHISKSRKLNRMDCANPLTWFRCVDWFVSYETDFKAFASISIEHSIKLVTHKTHNTIENELKMMQMSKMYSLRIVQHFFLSNFDRSILFYFDNVSHWPTHESTENVITHASQTKTADTWVFGHNNVERFDNNRRCG